MKYPDKITVYHKLTDIPDPSTFELQVLILSEAHQRAAARCYETIVTYDYKQNRKTPGLPPFIAEQFDETRKLQEEARTKWQRQVLDIEKRVSALEKGAV